MISIVLIFSVFAILILLSAFFWFWWVGPRSQVPPHLTETDLRRIEVQDRVRQTNYQVLTALGLGATFVTTLFQFMVSSQHWSNEFESRAAQERATQYIEAVKQIEGGAGPSSSKGNAPTMSEGSATSVAAARTLFLLGTQHSEDYHQLAHSVLSTYVLSKTLGKHILKTSRECRNDFGLSQKEFGELLNHEEKFGVTQDREEGLFGVQSAMSALGDARFSKFRLHNEGSGCSAKPLPGYNLRLEHAILDDLDLSGLDLSCSSMSQSKLRRVNLNKANLSHSDLRGARFADFDIAGSPAAIGTIRDRLYVDDASGGPPEWKRYRCWVSDLREANLSHADLEGAVLAGADLTNADLTGANLCRVDVSRTNFTGVKGLSEEMLKDACASKPHSDEQTYTQAQPVGLKYPVKRCGGQYACSSALKPPLSGAVSSNEFGPALKELRRNIVGDVTSLGLMSLAFGFFLWVGRVAKARLSVNLPGSTVVVPPRFPERSLRYSKKFLETFLRECKAAATFYRTPILYPLDIVAMVFLAAAIAFPSYHWFSASGVSWPWLALLVPLIYLAADFAEDALLVGVLKSEAISDSTFASLKKFTALKLIAVSAGVVQTVAALTIYVSTLGLPGWTSLWTRFAELFPTG